MPTIKDNYEYWLNFTKAENENQYLTNLTNNITFKMYLYVSLKVGLSPSKKNCVVGFIESPLKIMKNAFYFILKALFILKIFKFLS